MVDYFSQQKQGKDYPYIGSSISIFFFSSKLN